MAELAELKVISQQQLEVARQQSESIRSLATAFTEQARAYREVSRGLPDVVETARRSAQASEGAAYMAQRTLEAMRDLIEELRQRTQLGAVVSTSLLAHLGYPDFYRSISLFKFFS
jgi:methyl-accepting chemotaxis protein